MKQKNKMEKSVNFKFNGNLRDYQIETSEQILNHLIKFDSGLASIYTGWGKTCCALWIAHKLGKKTIIIVHTENLLNQWKERIKQFLDCDPGIIQGPKIDKSPDIVIGMIQSISGKDYPLDTFSDFGLCIFDECFPPDTYIHTNKGKITIYNLYSAWKKYGTKNNINILSYNKNEKKFEYKPLIYAWEKKNKNLIKISLSKIIIKCTLNHKILTTNGYIEADNLNVDDIVLAKYDKEHEINIICPALNSDQLQIVYGSYLGDGSLQITNKNRFRLKMIHGKNQKDYLYWKAFMFGIQNITYIEKNGYSQKEAYSFCTKCFDLESNSTLMSTIISNIDERGIAIWFMDDGSVSKHILKNKTIVYYAIIHSNNFTYEKHLLFLDLFLKFNIECKIGLSKNKYYYLYFNKNNTQLLFNLIKKYIHQNLYYKLNNSINSRYNWNNEFLEYGTLRVTNKEYIINNSNNVYDIEVEDNHNFIITSKPNIKIKQFIDGPIVSNCHHTPGRQFSKIFYKIGAKHNLGLSATLTRSDGLTKVIKYFLGDTIVNLKLCFIIPNIVIKYTSIEPLPEKTMVTGRINLPRMINDLVDSFARNLEIISIIKEKYSEERKILVLSDRRCHCIELKRILGPDYSSALYLGQMKNEVLAESNTKRVIFATYQIASEGYDNPPLDTLILATPKTKIEQAIGRILRQENKNKPEVIDIVDTFSIFNNMYYLKSKIL